LVESLAAKNDLPTIIDVIEMVTRKGCKIAQNTLERAFELSSLARDSDAYARTEVIGRQRFESTVIDAIKSKFPLSIVDDQEVNIETAPLADAAATFAASEAIGGKAA